MSARHRSRREAHAPRYTLRCELCSWERHHVPEQATAERRERHERTRHARHQTTHRVEEAP